MAFCIVYSLQQQQRYFFKIEKCQQLWVIYKLCDAGPETRFDRYIKSKLKIMSLEVDSVYHTECSMNAINEKGI